jgi:hypothetical protein
VLVEAAGLTAWKPAIQAAQKNVLGLAARERPLELLGEAPAGTEEQPLKRGGRHLEDLGNLGVRTALELAHHDCRALRWRQVLECAQDVGEARVPTVRRRIRKLLVELDLHGAAVCLAEMPTHLVVRDRRQPVLGLPRLRPLGHRPVRVQERLLRDVLCVRVIPEHGIDVAVDICCVATVETVETRRAYSAQQR